MIIRQLSVFVENKPGTLAEVLAALKEIEVNIRAMAVADTADFGILRIIVNEPDKVEQALREAGFTVKITQVLMLNVDDSPGSLYEQLQKLSEAGVNIEYVYAFAATGDDYARVVIKVDNLAKAERIANGEEQKNEQDQIETLPAFYW